MINKINKYIHENKLISAETKLVYAAVSGGIDSCVMLHVLNTLRNDLQFELKILHYNHKTRGQANTDDEKFVKSLAKDYGLSIQIGRLSGMRTKNSEGFLREQRYNFFNSVLVKIPNAIVATAHNSDDNIETFLMRLGRGSRLKGLVSIKSKRGNFIRPLLSCSRSEIVTYAKYNNIDYRVDVTNENNAITRNLIRNKMIPGLEKQFGKRFKQNVLNTIDDLSFHYSMYLDILRNAITRCVKITKFSVALNRKMYLRYEIPIRRGLIEYCISSLQPLNYGLSSRNFFLWDEFIKSATPGKKRNVFEMGYAISERKEVVFGKFPEERKEKYSLKPGYDVIIDDKYKISLESVNGKKVSFQKDKNIEIIDGEKSGSDLYIRFWEKGDVFRPLGMKNHRKLSDFFIDLKLSTGLKKNIPLLCNSDKIIWIAGYRLDDQFKVSDSTKKFYKITLSEVTFNAKK